MSCKIISVQIIFMFFYCNVDCQSSNLEKISSQNWHQLQQSRLKKQKTAMTILGGWAIGNIATGLVLEPRREGKSKYFHQMNMGWNVVNLMIAGAGFLGSQKAMKATYQADKAMREHYKIQKILLFNAGLDLGYMAAGAVLIERSKNPINLEDAARFRGFGESILLQGAFLFVFDLTTYFILAVDNKQLGKIVNGLSFRGKGFRFQMNF